MNYQTLKFDSRQWLLMFSTVLFGFLAAVGVSAANRNWVADFDGDGKTDISVYRPTNGVWYISKSSGGYLFVGWTLGRPVPGDFNGDGKTDFAVWTQGRSYFNVWYILNSSDYSFIEREWGGHEALLYYSTPTTLADYDGDGKTDLVNITTYRLVSDPVTDPYVEVLPSSGPFANRRPSLPSGGRVVSTDYDGDGKADLTIYRNGIWSIEQSTNGAFTTVSFGYSTDITVQADYDGDGKADIAVWRPSNGYWYWLSSRDGSFNSYQFGQQDDKPVPGDYDGDGKTDFAVFRPSIGTWYMQQSKDGFRAEQFGLSNDLPIPSYFY